MHFKWHWRRVTKNENGVISSANNRVCIIFLYYIIFVRYVCVNKIIYTSSTISSPLIGECQNYTEIGDLCRPIEIGGGDKLSMILHLIWPNGIFRGITRPQR